MKKMLFLGLLALSLNSVASVWEVKQQWSPGMESNYKKFLATRARTDMFSNEKLPDGSENPYFGIAADCADVVYSLRAIFSYEQKLPWAIRDPNNPKKLLTQEMTKYDKLPEGKARFRKFLTDLFNVVSTKSIANDTYPVSFKSVGPGVIISTSHINHHSWTIAQIDAKGNPRLVFNSTAAVGSGSRVIQQRASWPNPYWVFQADEKLKDSSKPDGEKIKIDVYKAGSYAGFRYWKPIDKLLEDEKTISGYSDDQYAVPLAKWHTELQKTFAKTKETIEEVVQRLLQDACADIKQRIEAVKDAENYKANLAAAFANTDPTSEQRDLIRNFNESSKVPSDKRCLTPERFDELSTPSRDRRLFDALMLARAFFQYGVESQSTAAFSAVGMKKAMKIFSTPQRPAREEVMSEKQKPIDGDSLCVFDYGTKKMDLAEAKRRVLLSYISPNPNEDLMGRWGENGTNRSALTKKCDTYGDNYAPYDLEKSETESRLNVENYIREMGGK